jgi:nucleotide-binding universal stress UspA family protein
MYKHILIATDGSEVAGRAVEHGLALAKSVGAKVTIATVTEPAAVVGASYATIAGTVFDPVPELLEAQREAAKRILHEALDRAGRAGVTATTALIDDSYPAEGIVSQATAEGCDLIVMGSHGRRGLGRMLLGSQTSNVLALSKIPVLVTR